MKFIRGAILCSILFVCILINIKSTFSAETKRRQSVMEYMNNFFSSDKTNHKSEKKFRFKENNRFRNHNHEADDDAAAAPAPAPAPAPAAAPVSNNTPASNSSITNSTSILNSGTVERSMTPDPILGEWFMISSKAFRDNRKFPPIRLTDGSLVKIETDMKDFRINNAHGSPHLEDKLPSNKFFWFRLSGLNVYYSSTKTDINILGAVSIDSLDAVVSTGTDASTEYISTCFTIKDLLRDEWKICGLNEKTVVSWYCQIKTFLKEEDLVMCPKEDPKTNIIEKTINITQPIIIIPIPSKQCNSGWNYQKEGEDWECDCSEGREQAPIDLPTKGDAIDSEVRPLFQYEPIEASGLAPTIDGSVGSDGKLKIHLKENLLRIFHNKFGKIVTMDGATYYAEEIVFHTPSEHTIKGKIYDMEIQIIHYGQSKGDIAKQIILSFLFEKTPGKYNQFLEDINFFDLPNPTSPVRDLPSKIFIPNLFKLSEEDDIISMEPFSFFTYQGSLTFPPCTEDTIIYVASNPLPIGSTALQLFQEALRIPDLMDEKGNVIVSDWIPRSARKTQPLNGRPVFHYDHEKNCPPRPNIKVEQKGHYEKIRKAITNYFFVGGNDPSGIPNAYVVSEDEAQGKGFGPRPSKAA